MASTKLTFKLIGSERDKGLVHLEDFANFCEGIFKCLRASESIVVGRAGAISYRITDMKCESATIQLQAVHKKNRPDERRQVIKFFRKTVANIEKHGRIDPRINVDDLAAFRELSEPLQHRVKRVVIGRVSLTEKFSKSLDHLLKEHSSYEGSVTGLLERINVHNDRNEFVLYPAVPGRQVVCVFPETMLEQVRAGMKRNVTVTGTLFYQPNNPVPTRVNAKQIEIHPADAELPTLFDVRESGTWDTEGMSALEFVRSLRDD